MNTNLRLTLAVLAVLTLTTSARADGEQPTKSEPCKQTEVATVTTEAGSDLEAGGAMGEPRGANTPQAKEARVKRQLELEKIWTQP